MPPGLYILRFTLSGGLSVLWFVLFAFNCACSRSVSLRVLSRACLVVRAVACAVFWFVFVHFFAVWTSRVGCPRVRSSLGLVPCFSAPWPVGGVCRLLRCGRPGGPGRRSRPGVPGAVGCFARAVPWLWPGCVGSRPLGRLNLLSRPCVAGHRGCAWWLPGASSCPGGPSGRSPGFSGPLGPFLAFWRGIGVLSPVSIASVEAVGPFRGFLPRK